MLCRLHYAANKQKVSSWTGFNIIVHDKDVIVANNVGYLPTINAPATEMSTVNEALNRSLVIMNMLNLSSIICVFVQAIYTKAFEIKCKEYEKFKPVVLRLGTFHTICTLLSLIGQRFQDAGLKDLFIEAEVIAEGSVSSVLEGKSYNRAVRTHKLAYEAFMGVALQGFQDWLEDSYPEDRPQVERHLSEIGTLAGDLSKEAHDMMLESFAFKRLSLLFEYYCCYLRTQNAPLSTF